MQHFDIQLKNVKATCLSRKSVKPQPMKRKLSAWSDTTRANLVYTHTSHILTWTETRHQPFQSALHGAALTGPTAALGSEATSSFPPLCGGQAAHSGRADIWTPQLPGTGWTWSLPRCSTWSDSPCSCSGQSQRWSPVNEQRDEINTGDLSRQKVNTEWKI